MRPGFDVYLDCSLAELAMMIEASKRLSKKERKLSKQQKLKKLIALANVKRKELLKAEKQNSEAQNEQSYSKNLEIVNEVDKDLVEVGT